MIPRFVRWRAESESLQISHWSSGGPWFGSLSRRATSNARVPRRFRGGFGCSNGAGVTGGGVGKEAGRAGAGEEVGIIACAGAGIGTVVIAGDIYASEYTMGVI